MKNIGNQTHFAKKALFLPKSSIFLKQEREVLFCFCKVIIFATAEISSLREKLSSDEASKQHVNTGTRKAKIVFVFGV